MEPVNGLMKRNRLRRLQWGVRAALALGVAASVAANVMHARAELPARVISAWAPIALLVVIELISRVPVHRKSLAIGRHLAAGVVAAVAAWASYWHMAAVAARYGEEAVTAHLLPVSVDMLIVVASICLLEVGGRMRAELEPVGGEPSPVVATPSGEPSPPVATVADVVPVPRGTGRRQLARLVADVPADDERSARQLAEDLAPAAGIRPATARKYLTGMRGDR